MKNLLFFYPKDENEFNTIVGLCRFFNFDITKNIDNEKVINEFPYIVMDFSNHKLSLVDLSIKDCDKNRLNRKDFLGCIRAIIGACDSGEYSWKRPKDIVHDRNFNKYYLNDLEYEKIDENTYQISCTTFNILDKDYPLKIKQ